MIAEQADLPDKGNYSCLATIVFQESPGNPSHAQCRPFPIGLLNTSSRPARIRPTIVVRQIAAGARCQYSNDSRSVCLRLAQVPDFAFIAA